MMSPYLIERNHTHTFISRIQSALQKAVLTPFYILLHFIWLSGGLTSVNMA